MEAASSGRCDDYPDTAITMAASDGSMLPSGGKGVPHLGADLALGMQHQRAGRLDEAAQIYQKLHAAEPRNADLNFLMGTLCCDLGLFESACRFFEATLEIAQGAAPPCAAEARRLLPIALNGLADQEATAGNLDAAQRLFERALSWSPRDAASLRGIGRIALLRGDPAAAEDSLLASLRAQPEHAETLNWLGLARLQLRKFAAAEHSLRHALLLQPDLNQARNNLGLALHSQGKLSEAQVCFEQALAQDCAYSNARINLANSLRILGQHGRAQRELEMVLEAQPDSITALNNLGAVLQDRGQPRAALRWLTRALELAPDSPQCRWNLALTQLQMGDYVNGWSNFESRWTGCDTLQNALRLPAERQWRSEDLAGKHMLLWAEQGFGDTLQFIRFAQDLAARGAIVTAMVQQALVRLVRSAPGVSAALAQGTQLPQYDLHCPLMSLPFHLRVDTGVASLHGATPYLTAAPEAVLRWRQRVAAGAGLKVGLVWAGNSREHDPQHAAIDARRSISLEQLAPILATRGCSFFSLQKGPACAELRDAGARILDFSAEWSDFADTAALLANLDLVISVDTAVAHLAGALGKPIWLLNRYDSCWRWLLDRDDSPWYSSLRQFRQRAPGDWQPIIAAAAAALGEMALME
jgi:Tfp pilus assembly protein PilF